MLAEGDACNCGRIRRRQGCFEGQATDFEIHACSVVALKRRIEEIIAQHSGQTARKVSKDMERLLDDLRASESVRHHRPGHPRLHRNGVAAAASVSAGAHQPEGARGGRKEAAEVACTDRDEGASEIQAVEEDLARQVETRHTWPGSVAGRSRARGKQLKMLQDARTKRWARSHSGAGRAPKK